MARIRIVPSNAGGLRGVLLRFAGRSSYGYVPGIAQVLMPDLWVTALVGLLYNRVHLASSSSLSRLQREMVATVVNAKIGGAP
ncbi:MAG TPA: hypothetical protein VGA47_04470 [Candidatus Dormibacteraeota bacterium]